MPANVANVHSHTRSDISRKISFKNLQQPTKAKLTAQQLNTVCDFIGELPIISCPVT